VDRRVDAGKAIREGYESITVTRAYDPQRGVFAGKTARAIRQGRNQNCTKRPRYARWLILTEI
jgi:hypothetical protein